MTTKTVSQLDADGVYVGPAISYESPLEPGVFPLPAGCVEVAPPLPADGEVAVWNGGAWSLLPDRRGETWYLDGMPAVIDFIGNPGTKGYSKVAPDATLDDLRSAKIAAVVATSTARLAVGAPASGFHIALDDGSRADLTAMATTATAAMMGNISWPDSYARGWITIENARLPLATPADGLALASAVGNHYASIIQRRRDLKDAVLAAETEAALEAIDITAGWPTS